MASAMLLAEADVAAEALVNWLAVVVLVAEEEVEVDRRIPRSMPSTARCPMALYQVDLLLTETGTAWNSMATIIPGVEASSPQRADSTLPAPIPHAASLTVVREQTWRQFPWST